MFYNFFCNLTRFFSSTQKLTLAQQQLQADYEKLKAEESEKSHRLQELMSVENKKDSVRSIPYPDNKLLYDLSYSPKTFASWEKFMPYKNDDETKSNKNVILLNKDCKETLNTLTKFVNGQNSKPKSVFYIHPLHFHFILSLTLILFTHKCPHYWIMV